MSVASSLSFSTAVPFAMRHHFSCGTCCNVRHPSIPWAQHFVLAVSTLDSQRLRIWQTVKHVLHLTIYISYINLYITVLKTVSCISQILEKKWEHNEAVHQLFIDFKKAYDSVRREALYKILIEFGIPKKLVSLIKMCLTETEERSTSPQRSVNKSGPFIVAPCVMESIYCLLTNKCTFY